MKELTKEEKLKKLSFNTKELNFLEALVGTAMMDKEVLEAFEITPSESLNIRNKIYMLKFELKEDTIQDILKDVKKKK